MFIDSEMVQLFCTDAHPSLVSKESSAIEVTVLLLDDIWRFIYSPLENQAVLQKDVSQANVLHPVGYISADSSWTCDTVIHVHGVYARYR